MTATGNNSAPPLSLGGFVILTGSRVVAHRIRSRCAVASLAAILIARPAPGHAQTLEELRGLSIEQLGKIRVTAVAKATEPLSDAPAAIYVISHDDIIRSGATTL